MDRGRNPESIDVYRNLKTILYVPAETSVATGKYACRQRDKKERNIEIIERQKPVYKYTRDTKQQWPRMCKIAEGYLPVHSAFLDVSDKSCLLYDNVS